MLSFRFGVVAVFGIFVFLVLGPDWHLDVCFSLTCARKLAQGRAQDTYKITYVYSFVFMWSVVFSHVQTQRRAEDQCESRDRHR